MRRLTKYTHIEKVKTVKVKEILQQNSYKIVNDYNNGRSTCQIGKDLNVSNASVYVFLRDVCNVEMKKLPTIDQYKDQLTQMYSEGLSLYKIQKELDVPVTTLNRYAKKLNLDFSKNLRQREIPLKNNASEIIQEYESGIGCYKLAKKYDCGESSILRLLVDNGIEIRSLRKYTFNEQYFQKIDSPEKAYLLGFMVGDGYNAGNGKISLSVTDEEIVKFMKDQLEYTGEYYHIDGRGENHKDQYALHLFSHFMSSHLELNGCVKGKTYTAKFPTFDQVPEDLIRFWILGLFDADGTICCSKNKHCNTLQWNISIVGTQNLILEMLSFLVKKFGAHYNISTEKGKTMTLFRIRPTSRKTIHEFLQWLYTDAPFYLKRKHDKYLEFCEENF